MSRRTISDNSINISGYIPDRNRERLTLEATNFIFVDFFNGLLDDDVEDYSIRTVLAEAGGDIDLLFNIPDGEEEEPFDRNLRRLEFVDVNSENGHANVEINNEGGDRFAERLETISVVGASARLEIGNNRSREDDDNNLNYNDANLVREYGILGSRFMEALTEILVDATDGNAEVDISGSGSDLYMNELRKIVVHAKYEADLEISASANIPGHSGDHFMESLRSIEVISEMDDASLSISHDGGDEFMASLRTIHVESGTGPDASADVSISASANNDPQEALFTQNSYQIDPRFHEQFGGAGEDFMKNLQSITVIGNAGDTSLSISHSGGANFMKDLETIDLQAFGQHDVNANFNGNFTGPIYPQFPGSNELSISASVNTFDLPDLTGENFMPRLKSITLTSEKTGNSVSISASGTNDFMKSLEEIRLETLNGPDGFASEARNQISISASANLHNGYTRDYSASGGGVFFEGSARPDDFLGRNFMSSLKTIEIVSAAHDVSVSISHSGGANFMNSLESIFLEGRGEPDPVDYWFDVELDIQASANVGRVYTSYYDDNANAYVPIPLPGVSESDLHGDNFMTALKEITVLSHGAARAEVSISHEGGDDFMTDLRSIYVANTSEEGPVGGSNFDRNLNDSYVPPALKPDAELEIAARLAFEGAAGEAFMESLRTIDVMSESGVASLDIQAHQHDEFMRNIREIFVDGKIAALAEIHVSDFGVMGDVNTDRNYNNNNDFDLLGVPNVEGTGQDFMQRLESIVVNSDYGIADLSIDHTSGNNFMESLTSILVSGKSDTNLRLRNEDSDNFMSSLSSLDVMGSDANYALFGDEDFEEYYLTDWNTEYFGDADEFPELYAPIGDELLIENYFGELEEGPEEGNQPAGDDFMSSLEHVSLTSGINADVTISNGVPGEILQNFFFEFGFPLRGGPVPVGFPFGFPIFEGPIFPGLFLADILSRGSAEVGPFGGEDFMMDLNEIAVETGFDADVTLFTDTGSSFEELTSIDILANTAGFLPFFFDKNENGNGNINGNFNGNFNKNINGNGNGNFNGNPNGPFNPFFDIATSELTLMALNDGGGFDALNSIEMHGAGTFGGPLLPFGLNGLDNNGNGNGNFNGNFNDNGNGNGPIFGGGNLLVQLIGVNGDDLDVNLSTIYEGVISFVAEDTSELTSVKASADNAASLLFLGDQSSLEVIDLSDMNYNSYASVSFGEGQGGFPGPRNNELFDNNGNGNGNGNFNGNDNNGNGNFNGNRNDDNGNGDRNGNGELFEPAALGDELTVLVGDGFVDFFAAQGTTETFVFASDDNADINIFGFEMSDVLDVSNFGVESINELNIFGGNDLSVITAVDGNGNDPAFYGSIVLIGYDANLIDVDNFHFA